SSFWADDVFNLDYELLSIADLERYVRDNRHLPGIPTSKDVEEEGIDVASIQGKLLRKIEELHLYIIQLESRIKVLEK
ncbi:MAG TPA: TMF family protein, partial [Bacteroidia bacterium]|nr:TMF family protein [Bacteroidia bacterium]